jgi:ankyrin repeat protein
MSRLLHRAVFEDNLKLVNELIQKGHLNKRDNDGQTALHTASVFGRTEHAKILLENGANVHIKNNNGDIPLHTACTHGSQDIVDLLIKAGSNVNAIGFQNQTPLFRCSYGIESQKESKRNIIKKLIEAGCDVNIKCNGNPILYCIDDVESAKILIEANVNVNAVTDYHKQTPLMSAAMRGKYDLVKLLLENGANTLMKTELNKDALWYAVEMEHYDIAKLIANSHL